ncbi:MAG: helix-turn-helix domain-containing protein [Kiritimatiellia bacterium]
MSISLYYLFMYGDDIELGAHCRLSVGVQAGLVTCERDWSWAPAPLPDYDLWTVLGGEGQLTLNGKTFCLQAGVSFVFVPGSRVRAVHDPVNRLRVLYCHFRVLDAGGTLVRDAGRGWPDHPATIHDLRRVEMLGAILLEGVARGDAVGDRASALALRQLLVQRMLDARTVRPVPVDERIGRVLDAIQGAPEHPWDLAGMAKVAHVSVSQFRRLFYAATGVTPNVYLVRERVSRAQKLLIESDLTLTVIADTLGYRDVYYFNRQFRCVTGMPPAAYRRMHRPVGGVG